jgi:hypothetical protein
MKKWTFVRVGFDFRMIPSFVPLSSNTRHFNLNKLILMLLTSLVLTLLSISLAFAGKNITAGSSSKAANRLNRELPKSRLKVSPQVSRSSDPHNVPAVRSSGDHDYSYGLNLVGQHSF